MMLPQSVTANRFRRYKPAIAVNAAQRPDLERRAVIRAIAGVVPGR
jgi:hypothetical protein